MRTLVDIPEDDLNLLNQLSKAGDVPRAELVRQAIAHYLEPHRLAKKSSAFGLWADQPEDGLEFQKRLRDEW
ncbi:ribbon-helix-helix domain-containing protein [Granulicella sp. WH15]|uniref:ribbon-helix-helix domain-containing protein n=1 Tax=Granulicella sp. WH15 TaxID=2602070 RepID=UPI0013672C24|nr:ribbon-helix-helix domain-containing protein [Granulicella sp. WH15]QHN04461.1 ribbon-helix-helix domain-containing protein [Granulicella sp. WH15]